jgi:outer membrane protein assembly factor BamB
MRSLTAVEMPVVFGALLSCLSAFGGATRAAHGGDWPQILGPSRNGVAQQEPPLTAWPASGPRRVWSSSIGAGFAGPAVVGNRVLSFHRVKNADRIACLDAATGQPVWQTDFTASYAGGVNPDNGPRCVPLVHDSRVYLFGAAGSLHCVQLADGKTVWSREAYADFNGQEGYFGAGSTPVVADSKLLVNIGGRNAGIVAFDLANGNTLWKATDERASYSSPAIARVQDVPRVIFVTRLNCVALDPRNGQVAFSFPFGQTGPTVNAATPLIADGHLFLSASYGVGAKYSRLSAPPVEVWANDESMSSQYSTCVYRDLHFYGIHGREDYQSGELRCIEAATGRVRWSAAAPLTGSLILVGDQLLILTTDGQLLLARAQPDKYTELARAKISRHLTRSLPALSQGRLYFRDNADSGAPQLHCVQLRD